VSRPRGCRSGATLGGPTVCDLPVLSAEDADDLGLKYGPWCRQHGEQLIRGRSERKSSEVTTTIDGVLTAQQPQTIKDRKASTEERRRLLAADLVEYVVASDTHPLTRKKIAAALGVTDNSLSRSYPYVDDPRVVFVPGHWGGWRLADPAPADNAPTA
jgi:hypothetical protein